MASWRGTSGPPCCTVLSAATVSSSGCCRAAPDDSARSPRNKRQFAAKEIERVVKRRSRLEALASAHHDEFGRTCRGGGRFDDRVERGFLGVAEDRKQRASLAVVD